MVGQGLKSYRFLYTPRKHSMYQFDEVQLIISVTFGGKLEQFLYVFVVMIEVTSKFFWTPMHILKNKECDAVSYLLLYGCLKCIKKVLSYVIAITFVLHAETNLESKQTPVNLL